MSINQSNTSKGANGGSMPLATSNIKGGPGQTWCGSRKYAGPDMPVRPVGPTPTGNPSKTPRPGR